MKERERIFVLILIMMAVSLVVTGIAINLNYQAHVDQERARMVESAQSQARMIESIAEFDASYSRDYPGGPEAATLAQVVDAHEAFEGIGETGEFTLAYLDGDNIVFLLSHRHHDLEYPQPVPYSSGLAEPMKRALSGQSGTLIGLDYRGEDVLAAYEPVGVYGLGIVAKIDMAEVQAPFIQAGLVSLVLALLFVIAGAALFFHVGEPMIRSLEESEARHSKAQQMARFGSWEWDIGGNKTVWSDELYKIFRVSPEQFNPNAYDAFLDCLHPDDMDDVVATMDRAVKDKSGFSIDYRIVRPDGEVRNIYSTGEAVINGQGDVVRMSGASQDTTERKRAEKELEESAIYLDAMPDVLSVTTPQGKIVRVNQAFHNLWGYEPDEVLGMKALEMFPEREWPKLKEGAKNAMKTGKTMHFETSGLTKNGEEIPVSLSETALKDKHGNVTAIITVLKDITLHKKAEEVTRKAYEELRSLDTLKSDIIANVSHELRTPITIIRGALEMIKEAKDESEREILINMSMNALGRQNTIVGDLIEATKMKEKEDLKMKPVDIRNVIDIVTSEFKPLIIKNQLKVKTELDKDLPLVKADFDGLLHIFRNLLSNATKFSEMGGEITIEANEKEGMVEVCVSDTGIGIKEDKLDRVFDRFFQADSSSGRKYGGTGMGLSIAKDMVKAHGGEIWVESREGKGSRFYFTLQTGLTGL